MGNFFGKSEEAPAPVTVPRQANHFTGGIRSAPETTNGYSRINLANRTFRPPPEPIRDARTGQFPPDCYITTKDGTRYIPEGGGGYTFSSNRVGDGPGSTQQSYGSSNFTPGYVDASNRYKKPNQNVNRPPGPSKAGNGTQNNAKNKQKPKKQQRKQNPRQPKTSTEAPVDPGPVLPDALLDMDEYLAEYGYEKKNGNFVLKNTPDDVLGIQELLELAKKEGATITQKQESFKAILPQMYLDLLLTARQTPKREVTGQMLAIKLKEVNQSKHLRDKIIDMSTAINKFTIFRYLSVIDEILESDSPAFQNVKLEECNGARYRKSEKKFAFASNDVKKDRKERKATLAMVCINVGIKSASTVRPLMTLYAMLDSKEESQIQSKAVPLMVADIDKGVVTFIVTSPEIEAALAPLKEGTVTFWKLPNIRVSVGLHKAFQYIQKQPELTRKVFPEYSTEKQKDVFRYESAMDSEIYSLMRSSEIPFNDRQKEAVYAITRPVNTTFILFGPPGTGKTYTLVESIRQILAKYPNKKILICTPSNMAADAISLAILKRNFIDTAHISRLVSGGQDALLRNKTLDSITSYEQLKDPEGGVLRPVYELPPTEELILKRIVICTLGLSVMLSNNVSRGHFSHIIIDEAAQSSEMESWLPIGLLADEDTRVILAGDPKQLGPVTTMNCLNDTSFKISLLARLYGLPYFKNDRRNMVQLIENHRSHGQIVEIFSKMFYDGLLKSTSPTGFDSLCHVGILANKNFPVLFHSISGKEESAVNKSTKNEQEIEMVLQYVDVVRLEYGVPEKDIGIIAPYTYHGDAIRKRLTDKGIKEIVVGSVEKFQGSEKRVIIFSTVRTGGDLGFMKNELRFNTAISRAKHLLIIVGNESAFRGHKMWKEFIKTCRLNNSFSDKVGIVKNHPMNALTSGFNLLEV